MAKNVWSPVVTKTIYQKGNSIWLFAIKFGRILFIVFDENKFDGEQAITCYKNQDVKYLAGITIWN